MDSWCPPPAQQDSLPGSTRCTRRTRVTSRDGSVTAWESRGLASPTGPDQRPAARLIAGWGRPRGVTTAKRKGHEGHLAPAPESPPPHPEWERYVQTAEQPMQRACVVRPRVSVPMLKSLGLAAAVALAGAPWGMAQATNQAPSPVPSPPRPPAPASARAIHIN